VASRAERRWPSSAGTRLDAPAHKRQRAGGELVVAAGADDDQLAGRDLGGVVERVEGIDQHASEQRRGAAAHGMAAAFFDGADDERQVAAAVHDEDARHARVDRRVEDRERRAEAGADDQQAARIEALVALEVADREHASAQVRKTARQRRGASAEVERRLRARIGYWGATSEVVAPVPGRIGGRSLPQ
jgi:hypothetical protein